MTKDINEKPSSPPAEIRSEESPNGIVESENGNALRLIINAEAGANNEHLDEEYKAQIREASAIFKKEVNDAGREFLASYENLSKEDLLQKLADSPIWEKIPSYEESVASLKEKAPLITVDIGISRDMALAVANLRKMLEKLEKDLGPAVLVKLPIHFSDAGDNVRLMRNGALRVNLLVNSWKASVSAIENSTTVQKIKDNIELSTSTSIQEDTTKGILGDQKDPNKTAEEDLQSLDLEEVRDGYAHSVEASLTEPASPKEEEVILTPEPPEDAVVQAEPTVAEEQPAVVAEIPPADISSAERAEAEAEAEASLTSEEVAEEPVPAEGIEVAEIPVSSIREVPAEVESSTISLVEDPLRGEEAPILKKEKTDVEINSELNETRDRYVSEYKALKLELPKIGKRIGQKPEEVLKKLEFALDSSRFGERDDVVRKFAMKHGLTKEEVMVLKNGAEARSSYLEARKALAQHLFNKKRIQLELTKSGEDLKKDLAEYKAGELFNQIVIGEIEELQRQKIDEWPPEKKGLFKKIADKAIEGATAIGGWYSRRGKISKFLISSTLIMGIGIGTGAVAGVGSAAVLLAGRVPRYTMSILGAGLAKKYVAPWLDKRTEKKFAEKVDASRVDYLFEALDKKDAEYLAILKKKRKDKVVNSIATAVAMAGAGYGAGLLGRSLEGIAEATASQISTFPSNPPEQWVKDPEIESNVLRKTVIDREMAEPSRSTSASSVEAGVGSHSAESFVEVNKGGNDSVWKMAERQVRAHYGDRFIKMNGAQKTYVLDSIKDRMGDLAPDKIADGTKVDFKEFLGKESDMEKIFERADKLTKAQVRSIDMHDKALDEWVKTHRGEALTQAKANEIIESIGSPTPPENLPIGRSLADIWGVGTADDLPPPELFEANTVLEQEAHPEFYGETPASSDEAPPEFYEPSTGSETSPSAKPEVQVGQNLPKAIFDMQKFDGSTGEFSAIRDVSVDEFIKHVPTTHELDENPLLAQKLYEGHLEVKVQAMDGTEKMVNVSQNHIATRDFMEGMRTHLANRRIRFVSMSKYTDLLARSVRA